MALTTAQQVRMRIQDNWRRGMETLIGDGTASAFKLQQGAPYSVLVSATASVIKDLAQGWSATACTIDTARGYVEFSGIISAGTAMQMDYLWAVFGDDEIEYFTAQGSVRAAALMACRTLMGNAWKRARWVAPDGRQYDDSRAMEQLARWESSLISERTADQGPTVLVDSWAENQEDYW